MKKILYTFTAVVTFLISFYLTSLMTLFSTPDSISDNSSAISKANWFSKTREVRSPLDRKYLFLTDRERDGFRGPVKMVREGEEYFIIKGSDFERGEKISRDVIESFTTWVYNTDGAMISDEREPWDYSPVTPTKRVFDERGLLIEEINFYNFDERDQTVYSKNTYAYDDRGNLIESYAYDAGGNLRWKHIYRYKYDSYGNWVERVHVQVFSEKGLIPDRMVPGQYRRITYYEG